MRRGGGCWHISRNQPRLLALGAEEATRRRAKRPGMARHQTHNRAAKGPAHSGDKFQESKSSGPQMAQAIQLVWCPNPGDQPAWQKRARRQLERPEAPAALGKRTKRLMHSPRSTSVYCCFHAGMYACLLLTATSTRSR